MSTMINDRTYRIARENTQAMIVDVQERLTPHIYDHENIVKSFEKVTFSACDNNDSWHHLAQQNRSTVLLFGAEAHVCIMQTALDLLDNGMQPVIIGDAVGSRFPYDKKQAIRRIRRAGGVISTVESILFELCRSSEDPAFKTIINLIK